MKLSDVIAQFLVEQGITHAFAISGGASLHLIHSIAQTEGITYICPQHEQGCAFAADGYARVTGNMGCAIATSGPGATNLITGISSSYYDSVPVLFLTGQVASFRSKQDTGVRQMGFQETDIVDICRSITKYAVLVQDPYKILYELEKAIHIAKSGRQGPVLIDIPDDFQRMDIDPSKLLHYRSDEQNKESGYIDLEIIQNCLSAIKNSSRPVLIFGWGVHLSKSENLARELATYLGVPVVMTWAALDIMPFEDPLTVGGFGTHGTRFANFAVQNADLIIAVGSRLDTKATGTPATSFAREAKIIMVDIDATEIKKFERLRKKVDIEVVADCRIFLQEFLAVAKKNELTNFAPWINQISKWKQKYPQCLPEYEIQKQVNPYWMMKKLSEALDSKDVIFSDTGCAIAWLMQGMEFKKGQKFFHAFNNTPMGYALPAAIGACFALPGHRVICVAGDGGLQMSIQELATAAYHHVPIKIILLNNRGHGMVRQTQQMWLDGNLFATSPEGGLPTPDLVAIAIAYGFTVTTLEQNTDIPAKLKQLLESDGPALLHVELDPDAQVTPQVKFGRPNEDSTPLLERNEFISNMIVKPMEVSLLPNP
jgi:acetolactate synthase-1/2/3 large subunit